MSLLGTLTALLPNPSPALLQLIDAHQPFTHAASLPPAQLHAFLVKLSLLVLSRENFATALGNRRSAWSVAVRVIRQDRDGHVLSAYARGWVGGLLPLVGSVGQTTAPGGGLPPSHLGPLLDLLSAICGEAERYPALWRETVAPAVNKYAQALTGVVVRAHERGDAIQVELALPHLAPLIRLSPTPSRPLVSLLSPVLYSLLLVPPSRAARAAAADVLSTLHVLPGKAAAGVEFGRMARTAEGEVAGLVGWVMRGWTEEVGGEGKVVQLGKISQGVLGDLMVGGGGEGVRACMMAVEGWIELICRMLRYPTARMVSLPLGLLVTLGLRMLQLSPNSEPSLLADEAHRLALATAMPRLWSAGMRLLGCLIMVAGKHMLPWTGSIVEYTVYLLEELPKGAQTSRLAVLRFAHLVLSRLHLDASSATLPARLLKHNLAQLTTLLRPSTSATSAPDTDGAKPVGGSKKSRKRMREGAEDSLVGGMEGRAGRGLEDVEVKVVVEAMQVNAILHNHPAIPQPLLAYSIRLHLALRPLLAQRAATALSESVGAHAQVRKQLDNVLDAALRIGGGSGSGRPWMGAITGLDGTASMRNIEALVHPRLPPLNRPLPPAASLVFHTPQREAEQEIAKEVGATSAGADLEAAPEEKRRKVDDTPPALEQQRPTPHAPIETDGPPPKSQETVTPGTAPPGPPPSTLTTQETSLIAIKDDDALANETADLRETEPPLAGQVDPTFISRPSNPPPPASAPIAVSVQSRVVAKPASAEDDTRRWGYEAVIDSDGEEIPAIDLGDSSDDDEMLGPDEEGA